MNGSSIENTVLSGFEGPEKRLEIDFYPLSSSLEADQGLRRISKQRWQELCTLAKCSILVHTPNEFFDSFVLSESSLFVYPHKVIIKTCGTTTLLNAIPKLLEYASELSLAVQLVIYSRKNFLFPNEQLHPHHNWQAEVDLLNEYFDGSAYILGPLASEHWNVYVADYSPSDLETGDELIPVMENADLLAGDHRSASEASASFSKKILTPFSDDFCTLEVMMHHLAPDVAKTFYRTEDMEDSEKYPGMAELLPGCVSDEFRFNPCGYSMNGWADRRYSTVHVTPEEHCSYASFETNLTSRHYLPGHSGFSRLMNQVLSLFKPGNATVALFLKQQQSLSLVDSFVSLRGDTYGIPGYVLKRQTVTEMEGGHHVVMCYYESLEVANRPKPAKQPKMVPFVSGCPRLA